MIEEVAIATLVVGGTALLIKKCTNKKNDSVLNNTFTQSSNKHSKFNVNDNPEYTENLGKFNLEIIRDLFDEYKVDINRGVALRVLLDTIKAKSYSTLINDFYHSASNIIILLNKWDNINCRQYLVRSSNVSNYVYVLKEDIDLYLHNCNIHVQANTSLEQRVQMLINHYYKECFNQFVKRYEARINILKIDNTRLDIFDSIKSEMKSYIEFNS